MTTAQVVREVAEDLYAEELPRFRHDPTLYADDPWLAIADYARERFAAGETLADNPYPPGTRAHMEFGGAMLDLILESQDPNEEEEHRCQ